MKFPTADSSKKFGPVASFSEKTATANFYKKFFQNFLTAPLPLTTRTDEGPVTGPLIFSPLNFSAMKKRSNPFEKFIPKALTEQQTKAVKGGDGDQAPPPPWIGVGDDVDG